MPGAGGSGGAGKVSAARTAAEKSRMAGRKVKSFSPGFSFHISKDEIIAQAPPFRALLCRVCQLLLQPGSCTLRVCFQREAAFAAAVAGVRADAAVFLQTARRFWKDSGHLSGPAGAGALEAQFRLAPLRIACSMGTFPEVIKEGLNLQGIEVGKCLDPIQELTAAEKEKLRGVLADMKLL